MPVVINGTTGISGVDGSAATPAIQGTDTNTGVFFPAADTIAFVEGGTEVMRINSNGNITLGNIITLGSDGNLTLTGDLSFNSGYGSAAVGYGCRAWIRFSTSAGVPSISNDGNVTSITDNGTGNFTINFTTALVDANYAAVANYSETNSATGGGNDGQASCHTYATGSVRIYCARGDGSANDPARCSLIVCR